jgi:DNA-binding NarL/FixJ family response regulator
MLSVLVVEDNPTLRAALQAGLDATGAVRVSGQMASGEAALAACLASPPDAILMDVQLAGEMNGIQAAVAIRREYPRLPIVFYSIQDDDAYYRAFLRSGILTHYAYVRKSNHLLPRSVLSLLRDAVAGRSVIDPEIAARVREVRHQDENDPLDLLEPNERAVVSLLALGLYALFSGSNENNDDDDSSPGGGLMQPVS